MVDLMRSRRLAAAALALFVTTLVVVAAESGSGEDALPPRGDAGTPPAMGDAPSGGENIVVELLGGALAVAGAHPWWSGTLGALLLLVLAGALHNARSHTRQFPTPRNAARTFAQLKERAWLEMSREVGGARTFNFQGITATFDPAAVHALLTRKEHSARRSIIYKFYEWAMPCNDGLLVQDGEKWALHRRAVMPMFQGAYYGARARGFHDEVVRVFERRLQAASNGAGRFGAPAPGVAAGAVRLVDALDAFKESSVRILLLWAFGMDPDLPLSRELTAEMLHYLVVAWDDVVDSQGWLTAPQFLWNLGRLKASGDRIKGIVKRVLARPNDAYVHDAERPNMLQRMVDAGLDSVAVANEVNHLHGAHKALAFVLTATLFDLARHPKWVAAMRRELEAVVDGGLGDDAFPTRQDMERLPVCRAVMNEVLRMHVVSFGVVRRTGAPLEIAPGKVIPTDCDVMLLLHALHHDPAFWGDDAGDFNPSRWGVAADGGEAPPARAPPKHAFAPFLDGSRQCAGKGLAELEWTIAVHAIISRYDLLVAPEDAAHATLPLRDAMFTLTDGPVACTLAPRKK